MNNGVSAGAEGSALNELLSSTTLVVLRQKFADGRSTGIFIPELGYPGQWQTPWGRWARIRGTGAGSSDGGHAADEGRGTGRGRAAAARRRVFQLGAQRECDGSEDGAQSSGADVREG
jgi:hypothetical protein